MKTINLTKGGITIVDDEDYEWLSKWKWYSAKFPNNKNTYAVKYAGGTALMHRLIMGCKNLDGKMIDHKDLNSLNNQRTNLRFCTNSQNQANKKPVGVSKYMGVYPARIRYRRKKENCDIVYFYWRSVIKHAGKTITIGNFKNEEVAAKAYNEAAKKYHGEFARLNII